MLPFESETEHSCEDSSAITKYGKTIVSVFISKSNENWLPAVKLHSLVVQLQLRTTIAVQNSPFISIHSYCVDISHHNLRGFLLYPQCNKPASNDENDARAN